MDSSRNIDIDEFNVTQQIDFITKVYLLHS